MVSLTGVTSYFPTAQEGFTTTTSGSVSSGAATVGLNSVAGYTNGNIITMVIDPTDATKKQVFTGVVDTSGVQITGVKWTEGTNTTHSAGATVVDYETATAWAMYSKGLTTTIADQDGTLKTGAVDVAAVLASGVVTEPKLADNSVDSRAYVDNSIDAEHLATNAITLGYTEITSNFTTAAQTATQVTSLSVTVTIPSGGRKVKITLHAPNCSVNALGSSQLEIWDGTVGSGTRLSYAKGTSAGASYSVPITSIAVVTPSAGSKTYNASYYVDSNSGTLAAGSTAPAFILVEMI